MRLIDQIAARETRDGIESRRSALRGETSATRTPAAADTRAHIIGMAQFLATCEAQGRTLDGLLASEQREYDRRRRAITTAQQAEPATHTVNAARLRLTSKESSS